MSGRQAELVGLLRELVAVDTTSARSNVPLLELIIPRLERAGFRIEQQAYVDPRGTPKVNLLAHKGGRPGEPPALALVGHTDCVPFDPDWGEALALTEREGRLYGRGSCDTKGFIACALSAALHASDEDLGGGLMILLTADEEVGCVGAKRLVEAQLGKAKRAIVGEPTSLQPIRGHKGYCLAEVEVLGKEGHSAYPELGASAIFRAGRFLHRLEQLALTVLREETDPAFSPPYTTVNVGLIEGGKAKNVLPGSCRFSVEWRPIPGQSPEKVEQMLERVVEELRREEPAYEVRMEFVREDLGVRVPEDAAILAFLSRQGGRAVDTVAFGTELPYLTALGAEAAVFGPGDIRVAHQTGEFVPVEQLVRCEEILAEAIRHFCR